MMNEYCFCTNNKKYKFVFDPLSKHSYSVVSWGVAAFFPNEKLHWIFKDNFM